MKSIDLIKYYISTKFWLPFRRMLMTSSPRWLVLLIDLFISYIAFWFTYLVRFNFSMSFDARRTFYQSLIFLGLSFVMFMIFKPYKGVVRHTGWVDLRKITLSSISLAMILWIFTFLSRESLLPDLFNFPYSIIFLSAMFQGLFMSGARTVYKSLYYRLARQKGKPLNVLIYGTDDTAVQTFELLKNDINRHYIFKGFLDNKKNNGGRLLQGIPILAYDEIDEDFLQKEQIDYVIFTQHVADPIKFLDKTEVFVSAGVKIKTLPPPERWIDNIFHIEDIREFDLEALLERPPIQPDDSELAQSIAGKVIWVTGAAGSIGSELARQLLYYNPAKVYLFDQAETPLYELERELSEKGYDNFESILADIQDYDKMEKCFARFRPDIIFHAAAYKHVPVLEKNPYYGITVNILATKKLMTFAMENKVEKFIQISTDKAVNPTGIMGTTKRVAELIARCMQEKSDRTQFIVTRFGNVLGSNGSVIHFFKRQIKKGGPVTVTHKDINRYFMTITEASHLVLKAAETGSGGQIYVFDMGEPVKIFDLAVKMIRLSGKRYPEDIEIRFTGLRPGEKIYEELLTDSEQVEKSDHEKLYVSKLSSIDCAFLENKIAELEKAVQQLDMQRAVAILKEIVPEYRPAYNEKSEE